MRSINVIGQKLWRALSPHYPTGSVASYFSVPKYPGCDLTMKRRLNFYLVRLQRLLGHTKLVGHPTILSIDAANACNLRCPYCFTGMGERSREELLFPPPLWQQVIDELGDHLLQIEFCSWGEPLLNRDVCDQIQIASARGISTIVSTNFSLPFDSARAEALVSSELAILGVAIDGARQETYEQYRVGGDLATVVANVRLVQEAKERLRSHTPRLVWSFHVFEHNKDDIEQAKSMAEELRMEIHVSKGWVEGEEWGKDSDVKFPPNLGADGCWFLWERATVQVDGSVSPCDGTFYKEDDFGSINGMSFREIWNNERFQQARELFRSRRSCGDASELVCYDCPTTVKREDYVKHLAAGGTRRTFKPRFTPNDGFNYFFRRRPGPAQVG